MILKEPLPLYLGDVVKLRKRHPCGGFDWIIVRTGVDTGLKCTTCGRRVLLPRMTAEKRIKAFISRGPEAPPGDEPRTPRELLGSGLTIADLER